MVIIRRRFPATARARPGARVPAAGPRDAPRVGLAAPRAAPTPASPPPAGRHEIAGPRRPSSWKPARHPAAGSSRRRGGGGTAIALAEDEEASLLWAALGSRNGHSATVLVGAAAKSLPIQRGIISPGPMSARPVTGPMPLDRSLSPDWAVGIVFGAPRVRPPALSSVNPVSGDPSGKLRGLGPPLPEGVAERRRRAGQGGAAPGGAGRGGARGGGGGGGGGGPGGAVAAAAGGGRPGFGGRRGAAWGSPRGPRLRD